MRSLLHAQLQKCADVAAVLECVLDCSLELTGAHLGNVQLMDWAAGHLKIGAQRGFGPEFLAFFKRVALNDGTACGRALHSRSTVVIPDIMADAGFLPYRDVAARAGFRSVRSTPLVSRSGALVGVLSNHFAVASRPDSFQLERVQEAAGLAADAIIGIRAHDHEHLLASSVRSLEQSYRALDAAEKLLTRWPRPRSPADRL